MPLDDKMRKLTHARRLWEGILDTISITDVFKDEPIKKESYDVDHFIPWSFVMNDVEFNANGFLSEFIKKQPSAAVGQILCAFC